jgi:hypothetical protein
LIACAAVLTIGLRELAPADASSGEEGEVRNLATQTAAATHKVADSLHKDAVHEQILIKAPPCKVWQSMLEQRKHDPDSQYVKPVSHAGRDLVEQKFKFPSPFGDAECILHLAEKPAERVDFHLFESEDLKAMEGSWILKPSEDGQATLLILSSYVEPNIFLPRMITNGIVSHRAKRSLAQVKKIAESM